MTAPIGQLGSSCVPRSCTCQDTSARAQTMPQLLKQLCSLAGASRKAPMKMLLHPVSAPCACGQASGGAQHMNPPSSVYLCCVTSSWDTVSSMVVNGKHTSWVPFAPACLYSKTPRKVLAESACKRRQPVVAGVPKCSYGGVGGLGDALALVVRHTWLLWQRYSQHCVRFRHSMRRAGPLAHVLCHYHRQAN